ncbi:hypothetical protein [Burkholderia sp. Ac-20353]|nr:hypothetical protein [Burkholderia sp. Ac-20353]MBN3787214.1 hypothetical protein [Burkholderia sp. Ac-20353]
MSADLHAGNHVRKPVKGVRERGRMPGGGETRRRMRDGITRIWRESGCT